MGAEDPVTRAFIAAARHELREALEKIRHCVSQLSDDEIWWRPSPDMNAIGNLMLHLCGNLRQWIVCGVGGAADSRNRPAEFAERGPIPGSELLKRLVEVVAEADEALDRCDGENLTRARKVQHGEQTGAAAIFHSVSHFVGHTQEITYITRMRLGPGYKFKGIAATSH